MSLLREHPLGEPVPDTVHAVCVSLPKMADVIGYEERHPETMAAVKFGYPRFVFHDYVVKAANLAAKRHDVVGRAVYAVTSAAAAWALAEYVSADSHAILPEADFVMVHFPDTPEVRKQAKAFLQHTGGSISSRQAEDYLHAADHNFPIQEEDSFAGDEEAHVLGALRQYIDSKHLYIANCGMNAFYATIRAVSEMQRPRGKTLYLQLGWLYLDTQKVLSELLQSGDEVIVQLDVFDLEAIDQIFEEHGDKLAAVVTELPTNPLVQTPDFEHLSALCQKYDTVRIFDPSVAGIANVDALPFCDVLVTSLTKYAASQADVMIGAVAVNEGSVFADELAPAIRRLVEPPYPRDLARLAAQIDEMPQVVAQQNENAAKVVEYLEAHPAVGKVFHPKKSDSAKHFSELARTDASLGCIVTFELEKPLVDFYDKSTVVKGPSFGTDYTMMCPFLYLAHYDLVSNDFGRAYLKERGLNPELIRLSIGTEPFEEIQAALEAGLSD
ncbi:PLP-dependent transferase [Rubellicoccus peritrichatus]|uniref:PLP-dependent transferase n=1 Tax=Rubellicoccus peritrichatus TaxID=3080537 RepID=A0AAQ3LB25_9BACT|nr:PLP-dependent transferase [Puniceicoccus sp. CR14]WOO42426.1 PLP-dependent transferase [Puniceicoccus sp. CR14]